MRLSVVRSYALNAVQLARTVVIVCILCAPLAAHAWTAPSVNGRVLEVSAIVDGSFTIRMDVAICARSSTPNVARADLVAVFAGRPGPTAAGLSRMLSLATAAQLSKAQVRTYADEPADPSLPCTLGALAMLP